MMHLAQEPRGGAVTTKEDDDSDYLARKITMLHPARLRALYVLVTVLLPALLPHISLDQLYNALTDYVRQAHYHTREYLS